MAKEKRKVGRPKKEDYEAINKRVTICFNTLEKNTFIRMAQKEHMTLSSYLRQKLVRELYEPMDEDESYVDPYEADNLDDSYWNEGGVK